MNQLVVNFSDKALNSNYEIFRRYILSKLSTRKFVLLMDYLYIYLFFLTVSCVGHFLDIAEITGRPPLPYFP